MDFKTYLAEKMKNPEFKKEWDALGPEFEQAHAKIVQRKKIENQRKPKAVRA